MKAMLVEFRNAVVAGLGLGVGLALVIGGSYWASTAMAMKVPIIH